MTLFLICVCAISWILFAYFNNKQQRKKSLERKESTYEYFEDQSQTFMPSDITFELKGLSYRTKKDIGAARLLEKGDRVILQREPTNEQDPFAIKILTRPGNFIGYVDREYSKMLTQQFDYLIAEIDSVRHVEIPFIYIKVSFSQLPISQPQIETAPDKLSPTERMMILEDIVGSIKTDNTIPIGCCQYGFNISWTEELPRDNIMRAKMCRKGDALTLVVQSHSRYPGRVEVYTDDNVLIGFIDEDAHKGLSEHIDVVSSVLIDSAEAFDRMSGKLFLPTEILESMPISHGYFDYPYKEVQEASYLAKEDPNLALDMLRYAIDHEKGIYAKGVALKCYWHLKDWEARREMALRMLNIIDSMSEDETSPFNYQIHKTRRYNELIKIVETCDKKLQPKRKRNL